MRIFSLVVAAVFAGSLFTFLLTTAAAPAEDAAFEVSLEKLAAEQRKSLGARKSDSSGCMTIAAKAHAKRMATEKKVSTLSVGSIQDSCNKRAVFVLTSSGPSSAAAVLRYWKESSGGKSRLGNKNYVWQGVGVHRDTDDRPYTTLILGTAPKPPPTSKPAPAPKPSPTSKPVPAPKPSPTSKPVPAPKPPPAPKPAPAPAAPAEDATHVARVYTEHSNTRSTHGKRTLSENACLQQYAQTHADRMARENRMYHQDLTPIMSACGLSSIGENVALGQTSAKSVQQAWMNSPGHRTNILNNDYNRMGAGVGKTSDGRLTWVVVLGRA